ncbi:MAG: glycosyltransferase [Chloroflexota bacterium]|nr:glycosyltransferase [Chloroflexota bacterium]
MLPGAGSEAGVGWVWSRLLAGLGDATVLTRPFPGRAATIEGAIARLPATERPRMAYVDVPRWMSFVGRAHSSVWGRLEYLTWQVLALRAARRLHRERPFDLAWHLVYANVWIGSLASRVGPPFVYGPVGGGVAPPRGLTWSLGAWGVGYEALRAAARTAGRWVNPLARISWGRAALVLTQNPETRTWLPASVRERAVVMPNAVAEAPPVPVADRARTHVALFAGRLMPLKGVHIAVRAIAHLPAWRLVVCGDGPDRDRIRRVARSLGVADRVELRGQVPHDEVLRLMRDEAEVLLFPSLHEEGCWTALEAASCGLPVVCLDRGAPPLVATIAVAPASLDLTARRLARAVLEVDTAAVAPNVTSFGIAARRAQLARLLAERGIVAGTYASDRATAR